MIYAEIDGNGNARGVVVTGKLRKKISLGEFRSLNDVKTRDVYASLTDNSIVNKVYMFPSQLNKKQLSIAISQKVSTDAEFSILKEPEYVDSKLVCGANCDYLISAIDSGIIERFKSLRALTVTPQVIASSLPGESVTFMLIHSFGKSTFIFIVRNGIVDSVRSISSSSLTDSFIASTLEFYKERKRISIDKFYYSGDKNPIEGLSYKILPITDLKPISDMVKKVDFSEDEFTEFLIPILLYLSKSKIPFFFKRISVNLTPIAVPVSLLLTLASISYFMNFASLKSSKDNLSLELMGMERRKRNIDEKILKVRDEIDKGEEFLKSTKYLATLSYPMIYGFIQSLKPISKFYGTYILSLSYKDNSIGMKTITFNPKENFSGFLGALSNNPYIENLKILSIVDSKELNAEVCSLEFSIKGKKYE